MQPILVCCVVLLFARANSIEVKGFFDNDDLDWLTSPTDDFFQFVNGRWVNRTTIPPSQVGWGGLYQMEDENLSHLKTLLDELTSKGSSPSSYPADSIDRKLGDLYIAALDVQALEQTGLQPLEENLRQINSVSTYEELMIVVLNWYKRSDRGLIFEFEVSVDGRNSSVNMAIWKQSGLLLPERDYYFRNDPLSKTIRAQYVTYIDRLLQLSNGLLNVTTDLIDAEDIISLETQLAVSHQTPLEQRDVEKSYHKYGVVELDGMMPNLHWPRLLDALEIRNDTVLVYQPDYYRSLDKLLVSQSLAVWKNKIRVALLHEMSNYMNGDFVKARFDMFNRLLYGQREEKPRWMNFINQLNNYAGELLGKAYVDRYFSEDAKQRTLKLVRHLMSAYRERIQHNAWMSAVTKAKALIKLDKINPKIGYPSTWRSFAGVQIHRRAYLESMLNLFQYNYRKKIDDLKKLPDRDEWFLPPQIVNAFYNPSFNEIIFPAAFLQEPFFVFTADDAINYGAVGAVIGHELTHAFDDQGRKFDENGDLRSWWTPADAQKFRALAAIAVEQYNEFQVLNVHVNGLLTLGENLADRGGVEIAFAAFQQTQQAKEGILIDGFTPQQRFFLSFARVWRMVVTDTQALFSLKIDPHAPFKTRTNGPLSNMIGFYEAYRVSEGDGMYREPSKRAGLW